ncbi:MAG: LysE family translocator [Oceanospirillaceae bacterium]|nr:LysE family translocator [Oceanospirillaceae bacterium]
MSVEAWLAFVLVWLLASIPLGPNALNCISISVAQGFKRSLFCVLGILLAALVFIAAVSSGLSAMLIAHEQAFVMVKMLGAVYLLWLGINMFRQSHRPLTIKGKSAQRPFIIARNSFFISISNPKAVLSYGAVFSQFIDQGQPIQSQLMVLVPTALVIVGVVYLAYCWLGLGVERFLSKKRRVTLFNKGIGTAYIAGGAAILGYESIKN